MRLREGERLRGFPRVRSRDSCFFLQCADQSVLQQLRLQRSWWATEPLPSTADPYPVRHPSGITDRSTVLDLRQAASCIRQPRLAQ
jgi:hypothetical protein